MMRSNFVLNIILILNGILWKSYVAAWPQQQIPAQQPVVQLQQPQNLPYQQPILPQQPQQQQWQQYQQWLQQQAQQQQLQQNAPQQPQQPLQFQQPQPPQQPITLSMVPSSQDNVITDVESYQSRFEGLKILKIKRSDPFMEVFGNNMERGRQYANREWRRLVALYKYA